MMQKGLVGSMLNCIREAEARAGTPAIDPTAACCLRAGPCRRAGALWPADSDRPTVRSPSAALCNASRVLSRSLPPASSVVLTASRVFSFSSFLSIVTPVSSLVFCTWRTPAAASATPTTTSIPIVTIIKRAMIILLSRSGHVGHAFGSARTRTSSCRVKRLGEHVIGARLHGQVDRFDVGRARHEHVAGFRLRAANVAADLAARHVPAWVVENDGVVGVLSSKLQRLRADPGDVRLPMFRGQYVRHVGATFLVVADDEDLDGFSCHVRALRDGMSLPEQGTKPLGRACWLLSRRTKSAYPVPTRRRIDLRHGSASPVPKVLAGVAGAGPPCNRTIRKRCGLKETNVADDRPGPGAMGRQDPCSVSDRS